MPFSYRIIVVLIGLFGWPVYACAEDVAFDQRPEVAKFIADLGKRHHLDVHRLHGLFSGVTVQEKILAAMDKPAEAKPWFSYRKLLVTEARIQGGLAFWQQNAEWLQRAEDRYGVPARMLVAIIGIETNYGQNTGNYRVVDALSTLAFAYPRRADFFRAELEQYLLLCREENIDPAQPKGSYAGAMGLPQFMPSSYRSYAIDLDGDGKRDIWSNPADAIGSVAKYFLANGWAHGESVVAEAHVTGKAWESLLERSMKPTQTLTTLRELGVVPAQPALRAAKVKLFRLEEETGASYWLSLQNFYVITRYNHSPLYAMAAFQLGELMAARR